MAPTRATRSGKAGSSPPAKQKGKRSADLGSGSSPVAKRGKTSKAPEQKTIEETMEGIETVEDDEKVTEQISTDDAAVEKLQQTEATNGSGDATMNESSKDDEDKSTNDKSDNTESQIKNDAKLAQDLADKDKAEQTISDKQSASNGEKSAQSDAKANGNSGKVGATVESSEKSEAQEKQDDQKTEASKPQKSDGDSTRADPNKPTHEKNAFDNVKADEGDAHKAAKEEMAQNDKEIATNNESIVKDDEREAAMPSSILEKGIIYFFFRSRVNIEDPQGMEDVARSYIVLRPLPIGAKLGDGPLEDTKNARLLALPKKVLPQSNRDRFLMFVDKANMSVQEIKEQLDGNDYATKTVGTSNTPAATPIAEGVYAITSTGRESHLAYHITIPESLGEIQKDIGINEKGSYALSVKNPNAPGPANATLDNPAEYPESLQKEFRNLRWTPLQPAFLDYQATQFLIIGEGFGDTASAMKELDKDAKDDAKVAPEEELQQLEDEDSRRVEGLKGDDAVFADLGLSSKEYPKTQTTW